MEPVTLYFLLTLFLWDGTTERYDAKFSTADECHEMGYLYVEGFQYYGYKCTLEYET